MDIKANNRKKKETEHGPVKKKEKWWILSYSIIGIICIAFYFLLQFHVFDELGKYKSFFQRLALAGTIVCIVFIITKMIEKIVARRSTTKKVSYNIIRLLRLLSILIGIFVIVTF